MSDLAIKIENLSKQYRLGQVGTGTMSHDLNRWWHQIRGKENPYLKIGESNDRSVKGNSEYVWALRDINLEVKKGEILGIIGKNGAGKSTLLKILSKVTSPSIGSIKTKGRLASLLEVGTGFHPEMTGRENIYMNGTIMGMNKLEITNKLEEIVDFAGVSRYLDTPVKRYSSGMTVRLGFAIAANLEPEILVVDEVLAVGDAEFQKKAIGKMQEVSKGGGRTVLFVTHNMASVKALCSSAVVLQNGLLDYIGSTNAAVENYLKKSTEAITLSKVWKTDKPGNEHIQINEFHIKPSLGNTVTIESGLDFMFSFNNNIEDINLAIGIHLFNYEDVIVFESSIFVSQENDSKNGTYTVKGKLLPYILNAGVYRIRIIFIQNQRYSLYKNENIIQFEIEDTFFDRGKNYNTVPGICRPNLNWTFKINS
ncbi:MAG: ATP-binding cassette domain-containing protein [Flavobacteriales bacterium]|nr:ATP-binding cassette domain-containing protein [Flavobacteriales bacterium]